MKKFYLFSVCLLSMSLSLTATPREQRNAPSAETQVATFEDVFAGIQEIWGSGVNQWQSGAYTFTTYKDDSWGNPYYYSFVVSDETENTSTGVAQPYRSTSGGAYEGDNFAVWFADFYGNNSITFDPQTVPGFFVNNNAYTVAAFVDGTQAPARVFTQEDQLLLYVIGKKDGIATDTITVELASNGRYIADWTYVDLLPLGEIDEVEFAMSSTDRISYDNGVTYYDNTPTYICLDNFGAEMPEGYVAPEKGIIPVQTALDEVSDGVKAEKVLMNNRLMIIRGGVMYDLQGRKQ
jgi:hypothetical protein